PETEYLVRVRGRGVGWTVVTGLVVGTASVSVGASPGLQLPARVGDPAQRLSSAHTHDITPEARAVVDMLGLVNRERAARGLAPLALDDRASAAARAHAADMAAVGRLQHTGTDGSDGGIRLQRAGLVTTWWGENIGVGFHEPAALLTA